MALREFKCNECEEIYEELANYDETGKYIGIFCPKCNSESKIQLMGGFSFNFTNPVNTDRWNSDTCGHDYRYKTKIPELKQQREIVEKASHVGPSPYNNIDDINSGKYFGPVQ